MTLYDINGQVLKGSSVSGGYSAKELEKIREKAASLTNKLKQMIDSMNAESLAEADASFFEWLEISGQSSKGKQQAT